MITKLTTEQENQIPKYIQKWLDIASVPMNVKKAKLVVEKMYSQMGEKKPIIIIGESPRQTVLLCSLFWVLFQNINKEQLGNQLSSQLSSQLDSQLYSQLHSQLYSQLDSQLYSQLHSQLYSQLHSQLDNQLYRQLDNQLDNQLSSQLYSQLHSQLRKQLSSQLHSQLRKQLSSQLHSQLYRQLDNQLSGINNNWYLGIWWLVWCGWYDYGKSIGVTFNEDIYGHWLTD